MTNAVFDALTRIADRAPTQHGGLMVFIDEMGKFLEGRHTMARTSTSSKSSRS